MGSEMCIRDRRFSFLKEDNDYFIDDILHECQKEENKLKIYNSVIDSEKVIEENYNIMQLSSPQMSVQCKHRIDETFEEYTPHYNQTEMRKLMIKDGVLTVNMVDLEQKFNDIITSFSG